MLLNTNTLPENNVPIINLQENIHNRAYKLLTETWVVPLLVTINNQSHSQIVGLDELVIMLKTIAGSTKSIVQAVQEGKINLKSTNYAEFNRVLEDFFLFPQERAATLSTWLENFSFQYNNHTVEITSSNVLEVISLNYRSVNGYWSTGCFKNYYLNNLVIQRALASYYLPKKLKTEGLLKAHIYYATKICSGKMIPQVIYFWFMGFIGIMSILKSISTIKNNKEDDNKNYLIGEYTFWLLISFTATLGFVWCILYPYCSNLIGIGWQVLATFLLVHLYIWPTIIFALLIGPGFFLGILKIIAEFTGGIFEVKKLSNKTNNQE